MDDFLRVLEIISWLNLDCRKKKNIIKYELLIFRFYSQAQYKDIPRLIGMDICKQAVHIHIKRLLNDLKNKLVETI